jgi:uncharacterized cupin superfamily protein
MMNRVRAGLALLVPLLCLSAACAQSPSPEPPAAGPSKLSVKGAMLLPDPIARKSVIAGNPDASTRPMHNDPDGKYAAGIWQCTPGSFRWTFGRDEFVYILEGEATVTYTGGKLITIRAGDAVYFTKGDCTWTITKTIKKVFAARE